VAARAGRIFTGKLSAGGDFSTNQSINQSRFISDRKRPLYMGKIIKAIKAIKQWEAILQ